MTVVRAGPCRVPASLLFALAFLSGCAASPPRPSPCEASLPFHLTLEGASMLNPDAEGRSLHTVVRVLQLEELARLRSIRTPAELLLNPREALGDELLGPPQDLTLAPGERLSRWFTRDPKARFVVVVGMFYQSPADAQWWSAYEFQPVRAPRCPEGGQVDQARIPGEGDARPGFRLEGYRIVPANSREWRR